MVRPEIQACSGVCFIEAEEKFTDSANKLAYVDVCIETNCDYKYLINNRLPTYIGCFKDDPLNRDFKHLLAEDLSVKDCFDLAKFKHRNRD